MRWSKAAEKMFTGGAQRVDGRIIVILTVWSLVCVALGWAFGYLSTL